MERIKKEAISAIREGYLVLGLRKRWGHVGPYLFRKEEEIEYLETEPRYSLAGIVKRILKKDPDIKLAAVMRGCDIRALRKFEEEVDLRRLRFIGIECSLEQAIKCNCEKPIYNTFECTGCWSCIEACKEGAIRRINVCPVVVPDEYNEGLSYRKAIYIKYPQAVPLKAARDPDACLKINDILDCKGCERVCQAGAIKLDDTERIEQIEVGAIIFASGLKVFDPSSIPNYNYRNHKNIMTSMEFERILSASGPTQGRLLINGKEPKKIAWIQCVGSRDIKTNQYCSSVCCMYAIKEAVVAKEHNPEVDCAIFYMDMRTYGKEFERYYERARKDGVRFIRARIHTIEEENGDLLIRYLDDKGMPKSELFDIVVLSVGFEIREEMEEILKRFGIRLTKGRFVYTDSFSPVSTSKKGIFVCGTISGPKDIPSSVIDASASACEVGILLSDVRGTAVKEKTLPAERDVSGERPKVGVFICHCGINIGGVINISELKEYAKTLPFVEHVEDNLYTCSQDTQEKIAQVIREKGLNRIVVAACSPRTHEPLFRETLISAGLNKYLFEMANIRNQDSWVHKDFPEDATDIAKDLIRMAVAKVSLMEPLKEEKISINKNVLVIGGGIAGMTAARSLSMQGYKVFLVEKEKELGGQARRIYKTWKGEDVQERLKALIEDVRNDKNIEVFLKAKIISVEGFVGNFKTKILSDGREYIIEHGAVIIAVGAKEYKPDEYLYGKDQRVITGLELDERFIKGDPSLKRLKSVVFIQCVGSRDKERPYCSKVCCTHSIKSALYLKELNPEMDIYILYRDIRTYGERENLYLEARKKGVLFIRYDLEKKPEVSNENGVLKVKVKDHILERDIIIQPDLIILASAIVPNEESEQIAKFFKVPLNEDGFFVESHPKLAPAEFATDGIYLCGMCHYPKPIDEAISQAKAAVSRATVLLTKDKILTEGYVAEVNPMLCSSCGTCIKICPYGAPYFIEEGPFKGKAAINPVLCKGCGLCVASCRSGAINLNGFRTEQIMSMIDEIRRIGE